VKHIAGEADQRALTDIKTQPASGEMRFV